MFINRHRDAAECLDLTCDMQLAATIARACANQWFSRCNFVLMKMWPSIDGAKLLAWFM